MNIHRVALVVSGLAVLGGCTSEPLKGGPVLTPSPLPKVRVGDRYYWDNGYTEQVVGIDGEVVQWQDGQGNRTSAYRNFALPALSWDWPETSAISMPAAKPDALWPLQTGSRARFPVTQRVVKKIQHSESTFRDEWECAVQGTETVSVPAGTFDTWRLRCIRFWNGSWVDDFTWNYAPALGAVVRRKDTSMDKPEELVAFLPGGTSPSAPQRGLLDSVRHRGLETLPSGQSAQEKGEGLVVTLTPIRTMITDKNVYCRDFQEDVVMDGVRSVMAAVACRNAQGHWTLPAKMP